MTDLLTILTEAPGRIAYAAEQVKQARRALDEAKNAVAVARAVATVENADKAKNQAILEAYVTQDKAVREAELNVIGKTAQWETAKIQHERQYNLFISARKIGGMSGDEMDALKGTTIGKGHDGLNDPTSFSSL